MQKKLNSKTAKAQALEAKRAKARERARAYRARKREALRKALRDSISEASSKKEPSPALFFLSKPKQNKKKFYQEKAETEESFDFEETPPESISKAEFYAQKKAEEHLRKAVEFYTRKNAELFAQRMRAELEKQAGFYAQKEAELSAQRGLSGKAGKVASPSQSKIKKEIEQILKILEAVPALYPEHSLPSKLEAKLAQVAKLLLMVKNEIDSWKVDAEEAVFQNRKGKIMVGNAEENSGNPELPPLQKTAENFLKALESKIKARGEGLRAQAFALLEEDAKLRANFSKTEAEIFELRGWRAEAFLRQAGAEENLREVDRLKLARETALQNEKAYFSAYKAKLAQIPSKELWESFSLSLLPLNFGENTAKAEKIFRELASLKFELGVAKTEGSEASETASKLEAEKKSLQELLQSLKPEI